MSRKEREGAARSRKERGGAGRSGEERGSSGDRAMNQKRKQPPVKEAASLAEPGQK